MEHPKTTYDARMAASSWLLPEIQHISTLPDVTIVHLDQCMLGQIAVKPTTLFCVRAEHTATLINQVPNACRCNHHAGYHQPDELLGRNEDGTWKTAKAKTYPSTPPTCADYLHVHFTTQSNEYGHNTSRKTNGIWKTTTPIFFSYHWTHTSTSNAARIACITDTCFRPTSDDAAESQ